MDAKTLKSIVKPHLVEDAYLNQYLLSRGINPKYVTKNQLVSHSKTSSYLQWKRDHAHMVVKETMMDPSAPTQSATDGGNSSDDVEPQPVNKKGLSKAAILVKSIHKKNSSFGEAVEKIEEVDQKTLSGYIRKTAFDKNREAGHETAKKKYFGRLEKKLSDKSIKEDLYDHEKEDKPAATAKKPTFQKPGTDSVTKETPQAAAVLSGGKTLTGTPRDVIEIDPMMKQRKSVPGSQKSV